MRLLRDQLQVQQSDNKLLLRYPYLVDKVPQVRIMCTHCWKA